MFGVGIVPGLPIKEVGRQSMPFPPSKKASWAAMPSIGTVSVSCSFVSETLLTEVVVVGVVLPVTVGLGLLLGGVMLVVVSGRLVSVDVVVDWRLVAVDELVARVVVVLAPDRP